MNPDDPHPPGTPAGPAARRRAVAAAGHAGDVVAATAGLADNDPTVRATAVGAMARLGALDDATVSSMAADASPAVRRRLATELGRRRRPGPVVASVPLAVVTALVADDDDSVAEAAAWATGELAGPDPHSDNAGDPGDDNADGMSASHGPSDIPADRPAGDPAGDPAAATAINTAVAALAAAATGHRDALVRESAVAALGAIGHPAGLDAVLAGTTDSPAVRRRAVIALVAFLGLPGVTEALEHAAGDRDWQVRQAAAVLTADDSG
jgi:HEAT repeat protein